MNKKEAIEYAKSKDFMGLSISKIMGKKIKDIEGYVSNEYSPVFQVVKIIYEDGTEQWFEGEHDYPYLGMMTNNDKLEKKFDKIIEAIDEEERI